MTTRDQEAGAETWITESLHGSFRSSYRADRVLFDTETGQQRLVLVDNPVFGRMLSLDGVTQVTQRDEFIYHEMLTHVPMLAHGKAKSVLIIGGGDGGILREVLRHPGVERATMVEIDAGVIDFSREWLPTVSDGAFDDPRLNLVIADGAAFVRESQDRFDVVIIDSTDPIGPGEVLFTDSFYGHVQRLLNPGGVVVTQNGVPFLQGDELVGTMRAFRALFQVATCYLVTVPTYVGGAMALGFGTDNTDMLNVTEAELAARLARLDFAPGYYTPAVHRGAFALPRYVEKLVEPD